jgi:hypothetical protein
MFVDVFDERDSAPRWKVKSVCDDFRECLIEIERDEKCPLCGIDNLNGWKILHSRQVLGDIEEKPMRVNLHPGVGPELFRLK